MHEPIGDPDTDVVGVAPLSRVEVVERRFGVRQAKNCLPHLSEVRDQRGIGQGLLET